MKPPREKWFCPWQCSISPSIPGRHTIPRLEALPSWFQCWHSGRPPPLQVPADLRGEGGVSECLFLSVANKRPLHVIHEFRWFFFYQRPYNESNYLSNPNCSPYGQKCKGTELGVGYTGWDCVAEPRRDRTENRCPSTEEWIKKMWYIYTKA